MSDDGSDVEDFRYGYWQSWGSVRIRIRILGFVPLTIGSGCGSGSQRYGSGWGFGTLLHLFTSFFKDKNVDTKQ
jgi:hypothetical protein